MWEHDKSVNAVVRAMCSSYPNLDQEEVRAEARLHALKALRSHDPAKSPVGGWIGMCVKRFLISALRSKRWRNRFAKQQSLPNYQTKEEFDLPKLLMEISEEAREAILLALKLESESRVISSLQEKGWEGDVLAKVWQEIRETLQ